MEVEMGPYYDNFERNSRVLESSIDYANDAKASEMFYFDSLKEI